MIAQRHLAETMQHSPRAMQFKLLADRVGGSPVAGGVPAFGKPALQMAGKALDGAGKAPPVQASKVIQRLESAIEVDGLKALLAANTDYKSSKKSASEIFVWHADTGSADSCHLHLFYKKSNWTVTFTGRKGAGNEHVGKDDLTAMDEKEATAAFATKHSNRALWEHLNDALAVVIDILKGEYGDPPGADD